MLNRRDFLKVAGITALVPTACVTRPRTGEWVNDVHSALNPTRVAAIERPASVTELQRILRRRGPVAISGSRHAMGGQQFASDTTLIDMRGMNRVLGLDRKTGIVEVEAGIEWPELISSDTKPWAIAQKQTGADRLTLGGGLAANIHGRGLRLPPFVGDIESFELIDAAGDRIECSRTKNSELFALAIGGYGLFGVVSSIRLRLVPRVALRRVVEVVRIEAVMPTLESRIEQGFRYGDFQFAIAEGADNFLTEGVLSCYLPCDCTPGEGARELRPQDWLDLLKLAHFDKRTAYESYRDYYMSTNGQTYWSDEHQLGYYPEGYHKQIEAAPASEIISELYVPRPRLADFMLAARDLLRRDPPGVIYGTVRLIERDAETFLAWAREPWACVIFNLHTPHTPEGQQRSANAFRGLIDLAIERGGSYFLTYHRYARRDQIDACYPQFAEFLRRKRSVDPQERFQSDWYRFYRNMYAS
jgi:FAD/FMN-containing dehydrogenase